MAWTLRITETAKRQLKKLDRSTAQNPRRRGKGLNANLTGLWRYRVGDYRLICDVQDGEMVVLVLQVAHRSQAPASQRIWIATTQESVKLVLTYAHRPLNPARPHRPARPSNAELSGILISAFELGFPCWGNTAAQNGPNMPLDP